MISFRTWGMCMSVASPKSSLVDLKTGHKYLLSCKYLLSLVLISKNPYPLLVRHSLNGNDIQKP